MLELKPNNSALSNTKHRRPKNNMSNVIYFCEQEIYGWKMIFLHFSLVLPIPLTLIQIEQRLNSVLYTAILLLPP